MVKIVHKATLVLHLVEWVAHYSSDSEMYHIILLLIDSFLPFPIAGQKHVISDQHYIQ